MGCLNTFIFSLLFFHGDFLHSFISSSDVIINSVVPNFQITYPHLYFTPLPGVSESVRAFKILNHRDVKDEGVIKIIVDEGDDGGSTCL